jgi:hypothetical protein
MPLTDVDFTVAVDPGYATQGVCVLNKAGMPIKLFSSVSTAGYDIYRRCHWQIHQLTELLAEIGGNVLLMIEEFHASQGGKTSHESVYRRGWYDALLREHIIPKVRFAVSVHAMKVHQWAEPFRNTQVVDGKKKWIKPTVQQIFEYVGRYTPWVNFSSVAFHPEKMWERRELRGFDAKGKKDSIEAKEKSIMHAADALVMGSMGYVGCLHPELAYERTPKQQEWIRAVHDDNIFQDAPKPGSR